jgi:hypothetical protein
VQFNALAATDSTLFRMSIEYVDVFDVAKKEELNFSSTSELIEKIKLEQE